MHGHLDILVAVDLEDVASDLCRDAAKTGAEQSGAEVKTGERGT